MIPEPDRPPSVKDASKALAIALLQAVLHLLGIAVVGALVVASLVYFVHGRYGAATSIAVIVIALAFPLAYIEELIRRRFRR